MSATTRAVASATALAAAGELNLPRWNEMRRSPLRVTTALRMFASPALSGLSTRSRNSRSPADSAEPKHPLARIDIDEDLVPGGRSQRRAALAQRVGDANQSHCVDGIDCEGRVRRIGRVRPGERVTNGVYVPAGICAGRVRQIRVRVQARPGAPMIFEVDEDRSLQDPPEAVEVGMKSCGHRRFAVGDCERSELPQHDLGRNAEGSDRAH